jgi:hypothetical protein
MEKKTSLQDFKRVTPFQEDPYKKFFTRGLGALAHH